MLSHSRCSLPAASRIFLATRPRNPLARVVAANDPASPDAAARTLRVLGLRIFQLDVPRGPGQRQRRTLAAHRRAGHRRRHLRRALGQRRPRRPPPPSPRSTASATLLETDAARTIDVVGKGTGRQTQELPVETGVFEKTLFWFDAAKRDKGRTFQRCDTLLAVSFEPTPGQAQTIRVSVTPVVRSTEQRPVITSTGDDYAVTMRRDETLFDLKLTADVPLGRFLIVSPSEELRQESSLGRQFFTREVPGEILERVYVIVPQVVAQKQIP